MCFGYAVGDVKEKSTDKVNAFVCSLLNSVGNKNDYYNFFSI